MSTTSSPTADILPFQLPLCPVLPQVIGNKDYTDFEILLGRIDVLLRSSGVEALFVRLSLDALRAEAREAGVELTDAHIARHREQSRLALRCEVLRELLMRPSCRVMRQRLAESALCRRVLRHRGNRAGAGARQKPAANLFHMAGARGDARGAR